MVKVSENFHIQLYSAMNYHPALGLANMDIFYQIEKNNVFSLKEIEPYYSLYLSMHLGAQKEFPFFLAASNKNDNNYYWIMGYNKEKNILKWLNDDFIVTDAKLSDFFIEKELLEKLEGYPEKALYS